MLRVDLKTKHSLAISIVRPISRCTYFREKLLKEKDIKDLWNFCKTCFTNKGICNDEPII